MPPPDWSYPQKRLHDQSGGGKFLGEFFWDLVLFCHGEVVSPSPSVRDALLGPRGYPLLRSRGLRQASSSPHHRQRNAGYRGQLLGVQTLIQWPHASCPWQRRPLVALVAHRTPAGRAGSLCPGLCSRSKRGHRHEDSWLSLRGVQHLWQDFRRVCSDMCVVVQLSSPQHNLLCSAVLLRTAHWQAWSSRCGCEVFRFLHALNLVPDRCSHAVMSCGAPHCSTACVCVLAVFPRMPFFPRNSNSCSILALPSPPRPPPPFPPPPLTPPPLPCHPMRVSCFHTLCSGVRV